MSSLPLAIIFLIIIQETLTASIQKYVDFRSYDPMSKHAPKPILNSNLGLGSYYPNPNLDVDCGTSPKCVPRHKNTKGESVFANIPSVPLFTDTFIHEVNSNEILRECFDISQTTPKQYGDFVRRYTDDVLLRIGVDSEIAAVVGEFAARAIAPNFDKLTMRVVSRAYANMAANFLFVDGDLQLDNAKELALLYAQSITDLARALMTSEPTSKFLALADGFVNFFLTLGLFTTTKAPTLGWIVGDEWFLAAVNYKDL